MSSIISKRISYKLIALISFNLTFIMVGSGVVSYQMEKARLYSSFESENTKIMDRLAFVLRDSLWYNDIEVMEKLVLFEMGEPNVLAISVTSNDKEDTLLRKEKPGGDKPATGTPKSVYAVREAEVLRDDELIGYIILETTDAHLRSVLKEDIAALVVELVVLTLVMAAAIFISVNNMVISKIRKIFSFINRISEGDLAGRLYVGSHDEMAQLALKMNEFIQKLNDTFGTLKNISMKNASTGDEIAVSMEEMAAGTEQIDITMGSIKKTTEFLNERIIRSSKDAGEIGDSIRQLRADVETQNESITTSTRMVSVMINAIEDLSRMTADKLEILNALSENTSKGGSEMSRLKGSIQAITASVEMVQGIIQVIDDVAQRSNLLAMNASVEAAHAGIYGRGFAVVAQEIRKFSTTTADNSRRVAQFLDEIVTRVKDSEEVTSRTESVIRRVLDDIANLSKSISDILESVRKIAQGNGEIKESLSEVISVTGRVKTASDVITESTTDILSMLQEINELSHENLSAIANIKDGISDTSSSMEVLARLGASNSETLQVIDRELKNFKTAQT